MSKHLRITLVAVVVTTLVVLTVVGVAFAGNNQQRSGTLAPGKQTCLLLLGSAPTAQSNMNANGRLDLELENPPGRSDYGFTSTTGTGSLTASLSNLHNFGIALACLTNLSSTSASYTLELDVQ